MSEENGALANVPGDEESARAKRFEGQEHRHKLEAELAAMKRGAAKDDAASD